MYTHRHLGGAESSEGMNRDCGFVSSYACGTNKSKDKCGMESALSCRFFAKFNQKLCQIQANLESSVSSYGKRESTKSPSY